jgi:hypothetical protein
MTYKRTNQVTNDEINGFKQIEINKILINLEQPTRFYKRRIMTFAISSVFILVLLMVLFNPKGDNALPPDSNDPSIIDPNDKEEDNTKFTLNITKVSNIQYLVEYQDEEYEFHLLYDAHVVYEGEVVSLSESFDMKMDYYYANEDIINSIDIQFNALKIDAFRYVLEVSINGENKYILLSNFPPHIGKTVSGLDLNIEDFEEDFIELFQMIKDYPPVFKEEKYNLPYYDINQEVLEYNDSRMIDNYTTYVTKYYYYEYYQSSEFDETTNYIKVDQMIVLNDQNEIISRPVHILDSNNEMKEQLLIEKGLSVFPKGVTLEAKSYVEIDDLSVDGMVVSFDYNDQTYKYLQLYDGKSNIDLSSVNSVTYEYSIPSFFEEVSGEYSISLDAVLYQGNLLVEPLPFPVNDNGFDIVQKIHVKLLDEHQEVIYEFDAWI